jgi:hypothetical protein
MVMLDPRHLKSRHLNRRELDRRKLNVRHLDWRQLNSRHPNFRHLNRRQFNRREVMVVAGSACLPEGRGSKQGGERNAPEDACSCHGGPRLLTVG